MKILPLTIAALVLLLGASSASTARAATCVLQGTIRVESADTFYCDTSHFSTATCNTWREVNLDTKTGTSAPPLQNALLLLTQNGIPLSAAVTSTTGAYSFSFNSASCSGITMRVNVYFDRRDPADTSKATFRLVDESNATLSTFRDFALNGTPATRDITFARANSASIVVRAPTVYHTANSAINEIRMWSVNLSNRFRSGLATDGTGAMRIQFSSTTTAVDSDWAAWRIRVKPDYSTHGAAIRHEIGHLVHSAVHNRVMDNLSCLSYQLHTYDPNDSHPGEGCEYAYAASIEALATVFGVRSVRTNEAVDAYYCDCPWINEASPGATDQDQCSQLGVSGGALGADTDRYRGCATGLGTVFGIGDNFATTVNHCIRLKGRQSNGQSGAGCACPDLDFNGTCDFQSPLTQADECPDTNADGICDNFVQIGFRNEVNVSRFLWDILDSNNESGQDVTDESISSFVTRFEGMPCTNPAGFGGDGNCNEPNRASAANCLPSFANNGNRVVGAMNSTRDGYNAWDLDALFVGDQGGVRTINCVAGATN